MKFLGLVIDNNLSWDTHVNTVANKITSGIFALYKMSKLCDLESLKIIYYAYIQSSIAFGISVYGATSKKNLDRILVLQKRALRIMLGLEYRESVKEHFVTHNIMTVYSLYIYEVILYTRQHCDSLQLLGSNHNYQTRNRENFSIPAHKLKFFEKKTTFVGSKFINKLPVSLKTENNFTKFKSKLKLHVILTIIFS